MNELNIIFSPCIIKGDDKILTVEVVIAKTIPVEKINTQIKNMILIIKIITNNIYIYIYI